MAAGQSTLEDQFDEVFTEAHKAMLAGRFTEAEGQFRELVQLQRRALGPEHAKTLDSQTSQAYAVGFMDRHVEAEAIYREVLQVKQQSPEFGMEHESTLQSVTALGQCLSSQRRFKEAEPMLRKVHALHVRLLGPRDLKTLHIQVALGNCLFETNRCEEAEGLLCDALEGHQALEAIPGNETDAAIATGVGGGMRDLAVCLCKDGKRAEAEPLLRAAVKYNRRRFGDEDILTITCMGWHAMALDTLGRHAEAEVMHRLNVQSKKAVYGCECRDTVNATHLFVKCLLVQQKLAAAEALIRDTLSHLQQALGEDHPIVLPWMRELAGLLLAQGQGSKRNEAKALLRRVRELASNRQG